MKHCKDCSNKNQERFYKLSSYGFNKYANANYEYKECGSMNVIEVKS